MSDPISFSTAPGGTHRLFVFAQGRMYDAAIEEYLCCIRYVVEGSQCRVKVIVVVESNRLDPGLDLL